MLFSSSITAPGSPGTPVPVDELSAAPPPAYLHPRPEVTSLVPEAARRVLDVGCCTGVIGRELVARGHRVVGIEADATYARAAREVLDDVIEADVEQLARGRGDVGGPYDCIVLADVLEHLVDPWAATRWAAGLLAEGGCLVISVPNIRHVHLLAHVVLGARWPYEATGIFDRTHLRWFARKNLPELVVGTGLAITVLTRSYVVRLEAQTRLGLFANRLARRLGDWGTLQFVFRAERPRLP